MGIVVVVVVVVLGGAVVGVVDFGGWVVGVVDFGGAVVVVVVVALLGGLLFNTVRVAVGVLPPAGVLPLAVPEVWPVPAGCDEASCVPEALEGPDGGFVAGLPPAGGVVVVVGVGVGTVGPLGERLGACCALRRDGAVDPVKSKPATTDMAAATALTDAMARLRRRCDVGPNAVAAATAAPAATGEGCPKSGDLKTSSRVA